MKRQNKEDLPGKLHVSFRAAKVLRRLDKVTAVSYFDRLEAVLDFLVN
ncbi:MAG: hypothetical protein OXH06_03675 [Gemmatimonadetes bacterium]|nr:hypothetical protein [Gemmatimonadota bacterium]MDE3256740.1 hypothetical protein [Gemmatimonadota bacterium]